MMNIQKRLTAALTAGLMGLCAVPQMPVSAADDVLRFEFEDGTLTDCEVTA